MPAVMAAIRFPVLSLPRNHELKQAPIIRRRKNSLSYNSPIWFILSVSPNRKDESMDDSPYDPAQIPAPASYHWTPRLQREFLEAFATN